MQWMVLISESQHNMFNTLTLRYSILKSHADFRLFIFFCLMSISSVYNANIVSHTFNSTNFSPIFCYIYKPKKLYVFHIISTFMFFFFLGLFKTTLKRMYFVRCLKDLNKCLFNKMPIIYFLSCSLSSHCCNKIQHEDLTWPNCTLTEFSILE